MHHAFLKGEFAKCINGFGKHAIENSYLIDNPDFSDESQNCKRSFLLSFRAPLLFKIPCSTIWHRVSLLEQNHLDELIVIGRCGWDAPGDQNELMYVAKRETEKMNSVPSEWHPPILWGHTKEGPFTIIEGNHRLVVYTASHDRQKLGIPVYIGLSSDYCFWHLPDLVA